MALGGMLVIGRSLNPLSKLACVAILTLDVSGSHQRMLRIAQGTQPRNTPCQEFGLSFAARLPGGQTHARHWKVPKWMKSLTMLVAFVMGDMAGSLQVGSASCILRAW